MGAWQPPEARILVLAERFHVLPWQLEREPLEDVMRWISILGVEGEVLSDRAGLPATEPIFYEDDDDLED